MTMLQRNSSHSSCASHIQGYLEWDGERRRSIASRFINLMPGDEQQYWAHHMDRLRSTFGNDESRNGRRAITYQHFVISPDPGCDASITQLMDLAEQWASEFFGTDLEPGRLGQYQIAMVAHDDGSNGVAHCHIIVNNTDLASGRRLQISNADNDLLWDRLQEISEERGLARFDSAKEHRRQHAVLESARNKLVTQGRYLTKVERELSRKRGHSWKQDIADLVKIARRTSTDMDGYLRELNQLGVAYRECVNPRGEADLIYSHPQNPARWQVSGYRLGKAYTMTAIADAISHDHAQRLPRLPEVRDRANAYTLEGFLGSLESAGLVKRNERIADVARALKLNDEHGIHCFEDYRRALGRLERLYSSAVSDQRREALARSIAHLRAARDLAERSELFCDVDDQGQERFERRTAPIAARPRRKHERGERGRSTGAGRARSTSTSRAHDRGRDERAR